MDVTITNIPATQEYCFLWIDWWATCMTKSEWSGWVQALGSIVAILASAGIVYWQVTRQEKGALKRSLGERIEAVFTYDAMIRIGLGMLDRAIMALPSRARVKALLDEGFLEELRIVLDITNLTDHAVMPRPAHAMAMRYINGAFGKAYTTLNGLQQPLAPPFADQLRNSARGKLEDVYDLIQHHHNSVVRWNNSLCDRASAEGCAREDRRLPDPGPQTPKKRTPQERALLPQRNP